MTRPEKIAVMEAAVDIAAGKVPVLAGVAEFTTHEACEFAREAAAVGIDGLMVLPAMAYSANAKCEHIAGRGSPLTRLPRLALDGTEKAEVEALMAAALSSRPKLTDPSVGANY